MAKIFTHPKIGLARGVMELKGGRRVAICGPTESGESGLGGGVMETLDHVAHTAVGPP
ncbi:hypothetical protein MCOR03_005800 [Pyricularia oryzae]|nr:hypothetical protein MCOR32_007897 [Pyricularia oryzae]KAI6557458.1 hypothetical protein MCOR03_005800 [Pyricularia oryzae]KAI6589260.1 hypothetical protein MCOR06_005521 [Pyricularia oryzae]